jgi:hypothetical protein
LDADFVDIDLLGPALLSSMLSTYTNFFTSAVRVGVSLGWNFGSQFFVRPCAFPVRVALSIIFREGVKVSLGTWINKKRRKRMDRLKCGIQLKISKTFRRVYRRNSSTKRGFAPVCVGGEHDIIDVDAALKYEALAGMRLDRARELFEESKKELKEAELAVADAKKYTERVKSYCKTYQENQSSSASDYVFVDPASNIYSKARKRVVVVKEEPMGTPNKDNSAKAIS